MKYISFIFLFVLLFTPKADAEVNCPGMFSLHIFTEITADPCIVQLTVSFAQRTNGPAFPINGVDITMGYAGASPIGGIISNSFGPSMNASVSSGHISLSSFGDNLTSHDVQGHIILNLELEYEECFELLSDPHYLYVNGQSDCIELVTTLECPELTASCIEITYAADQDCVVETPSLELESDCEIRDISMVGDLTCFTYYEGDCITVEIEDCPCGPDEVNGIDLVELHKLISGTYTNLPQNPFGAALGDLNCSGGVSILDLIIMQRFILGLPIDHIVPDDCPLPGECIIFDASQDPDGGSIYTNGMPTNEICDFSFPTELVVGVVGDVNGSCNCNDNEGIIDSDDSIQPHFTTKFSVYQSSTGTTISPTQDLSTNSLVMTFLLDENISTKQIEVNSNNDKSQIDKYIIGNELTVICEMPSTTKLKQNQPLIVIHDYKGNIELKNEGALNLVFTVDSFAKIQLSDLSSVITDKAEFRFNSFSLSNDIVVQGYDFEKGNIIIITDPLGRKVKEIRIGENSNKVLISLPKFNQILLVSIIDNEHNVSTRKIVH